MSSDSSNSAQLKLVICVDCRVDSELARYRRRKGCFPKPIVRFNVSIYVSVCCTKFLWHVIRYTTCNNDA